MNATEYLNLLLPEVILIVGACVTLLARTGDASRGARGGDGVAQSVEPAGHRPGNGAVPVLALITVLAALVVTMGRGAPVAPVDRLSGLLITTLTYYVRLIGLVMGALILLVNWWVPDRAERCEFFSMLLFSLSGLLLTAASNDLVVLFFAIELVSVPTYVLVALSRRDTRASEASVKYFFLGALSAAVMVYGFSFLYGAGGSTILNDGSPQCLAGCLGGTPDLPPYAIIGLLLAMCGLFFKIAAVPFHAYVADVYEGAAAPVSASLSFLPKLAGFVGLIHLCGVLDWKLPAALLWLLWVVAALSMTVGNTLALMQTNVKRILAYSSIAHTGYMLIGLLVGPLSGAGPLGDGIAALLFYVAVYGLMNLGAFSTLGSLRTPEGSAEQIHHLHGLSRSQPAAALIMAVCAFSLMGFPPTAGFLGKVYVFSSAFSVEAGRPFHGPLIALAIIGVVNSAVAAAYYLRVAAACYLGEERTETEPVGGTPMAFGLAVCCVALLVLFAWSTPLVSRARAAARRPILVWDGLAQRSVDTGAGESPTLVRQDAPERDAGSVGLTSGR